MPGAPFGEQGGGGDIDDHAHQYDHREPGAVVEQQNARHQRDFQQCGNDVEQHEAQQKADAANAAFDIPRQPAGTPRQMKIHVQRMQMFEHVERDPSHRAFGDPAEDQVAQLAEQDRRQPQGAVGQQQDHRQGHACAFVGVECIDDMLEHDRQQHGRALGADEQSQRQANAQAMFPEIGPEPGQAAPLVARRLGGGRVVVQINPESAVPASFGRHGVAGRRLCRASRRCVRRAAVAVPCAASRCRSRSRRPFPRASRRWRRRFAACAP